MLRASYPPPATELPSLHGESSNDILARIWPEFDPSGLGIMADLMEKVLRRVEQEQGTSLLPPNGWVELGDYIATVKGTVVSQKDLSDLLGLLQGPALNAEPLNQQQGAPFLGGDDRAPMGQFDIQQEAEEGQREDEYDYEQEQEQELQEQEQESFEAPRLYPRHHSGAPLRGKGNSIRKISLSESTQFRVRHPRNTHSSQDDSDDSDHHHSFHEHDSHSGESSQSSSPAPSKFNNSDWRGNGQGHNQFSIREPSQIEFEGCGLDTESPPDHDLEIESVQIAYLRLQKKLRQTELEYEARANEQTKEDEQNQQKIDDLKRDLKTMRREISELKYTEQSKTSQIAELEQQIEKSERTSSTQKNSAATLKKQKDELEEENEHMKESLRQKEEALNSAIIRLTAFEADSRRINADQETMEELRDRLAAEITKNEAMAFQLELMNTEKMRLTELTGSLKTEVENLGGGLSSPTLDYDGNIQTGGRTLMSELQTAGFEAGIEPSDVTPDSIAARSPESTATRSPDAKWDPAHEGARRLLQESTSFNLKLKRSSMRDLGQRFKESGLEKQLQSPSTYTPNTDLSQTADILSKALSLKTKVDDVDCELPPGLQSLESKEMLLNKELGTNAELIEDLFKAREPSHPLAVTLTAEMVLGREPSTAKQQKADRARRRKVQQSRVLTQAEVVDLLNPGHANSSEAYLNAPVPTTRVLSKKENSKVIANVTLVSMYTIVVYLFGVITSVFLVDNGQAGGFNYGRFLSFDALQETNFDDHPSRFKVVEILFYWLQNLVWQGDGAYVPT
ncbi:hypothetical protein EMPS_05745 [Entomortierella parvispora]|uniref:Uncharacterized protein n=1 Tax=Entomortierella parvispora TaxID=205924 RepID=A0A9P3LWS7_9FUNG|nr:hypothetical protein EMPS_05745 [Entomortierella parvispora]